MGQFSRGIVDRSISAIFKSQLQLFYNLLYQRQYITIYYVKNDIPLILTTFWGQLELRKFKMHRYDMLSLN